MSKSIWEQGETTNAAILKELEGQSNWTRHTVKTYITRLRNKGFVGVVQINTRNKRYYPLIEKEQYLAIETSNYLNNHYKNLVRYPRKTGQSTVCLFSLVSSLTLHENGQLFECRG